MKTFLQEIRGAVMATIILATVCSGIYPLIVYGIAQVAFRNKANGSLIYDSKGVLRGSALLGQQFTGDNYFNSRPSAAGNGYDAASSGGSNLGPTSQKLSDTLKNCIADYRKKNGLKDTDPVPADAVTASGSGLDPHISVRNAELQLPRVAKARGITPEKLTELVRRFTEGPDGGILGDAGVNVLKLNLALDRMK